MLQKMFLTENKKGLNSLYLEYQEWKANNFVLHICIPTFMLRKSLLQHKIDSIPEAYLS